MALILGDAAYPQIGVRDYMERFRPFFSGRQTRKLRVAYTFSKEGHRGKVRDDGRRYFDHPRACSWIAIDELCYHDPVMHNALLIHDIPEDTFLLTVESIEETFDEETAIIVNLLTHRKGDSTEQYVKNLRECARARVIGAKLIDRLHNLRTLGACTPEKRQRKVTETVEHYLPLAKQLVDHMDPQYRWRAIYLRDGIQELVDYWSANTTTP